MSQEIKTILFDAGNVLCTFSHYSASKEIVSLIGTISPEEFNEEWFSGTKAEVRQIGKQSGEELYESLKQQYDFDFSKYDYRWFRQIWGDIFKPAPRSLLEILQSIDETVPVHIASNTEELHWPYLAKLDTIDYISKRPSSKIFKSYDVGHEKPNPEFFNSILDTLDIDAEYILFIDDLVDNREAFKNLGGQAKAFDINHDDPTVLKKILSRHSLLV